MIAEIFIFIFTTVVSCALYTYKKNHWYFESRDVKYLPGVPIFGNTLKSMFAKSHFVHDLSEVYNSFPEERYTGFIEGVRPIVMIRDPELIKAITVKDFDHFVDHRHLFAEPMFEDSLFQMRGNKWREMRVTLSPAFTSSKIKQMVPFMDKISKNIVQFLKENEGQDIHVDDCIRCFTTDVIASTAFGLRVNSLEDKDNKFYKNGLSLTVFTTSQRMKIFLSMLIPIFGKFIKIFPGGEIGFFRNIMKSTMNYRKKNKVERPDMIQLLMEASKEWTQNELAAQVFVFFLAGFDSVASALVMAIHQMALVPKIQDKLYEEVKAFNQKYQAISYEQMHELKYLDAVVNESLRMWSPAILDRVCAKDYSLPPAQEGGKPYLFLRIFPPGVTSFFRDIVKSTMDYREKNKIERPDMIQLLMEASKGTLKTNSSAADKHVGFAVTEEGNIKPAREIRHWTQDELAAQAFIFFAAGFDSVATVLVLAIHQMALEPKIQNKLYEEVNAFHKKYQAISYEQLHELKYLDAVINETLRIWSPAIILDRQCQKDYILPPAHEGGKSNLIKKGDMVYNMVNALHMDPQYFPDPKSFDPERFSDENKHNIKPFTFMPFGSGPRNCIASRFALLEMKVFLYHLVLNFKVEKCQKTTDPIQLTPEGFNLRAMNGSWVKTVARK